MDLTVSDTRALRRFTGLAVLAALALAACAGGPLGPTLDQIADQQTTLGESVEVPLAIAGSDPAAVTLSATSGDEQVVPDSGLVITGSGANRTLTLTPSSVVAGTAVITVTAQDANGSASRQFEVEVSEPFEPPADPLTPENGDLIGVAVDIDEQYAVVGGFESVYVFERVGDGWQERQKLGFTAQNGIAVDFGGSVAVDGVHIIVGADSDPAGGENSGAAYIFKRVGDTWVQNIRLTDPVPVEFDSFGRSVAIEGEYAFVGAQGDTNNDIESGSVFVYQEFDVGGWSLLAKLSPADAQEADVFGESVSVDGDTLIVGNYGDPAHGVEAGSATIFTLDSFIWGETIELSPTQLEAGDQFGLDVAVSGDYALVGAPNDDDGAENAGAVYVFHDDGSGWALIDKLLATDPTDNDAFGSSVDLDYPYAVVGANLDDDPLTDAGSAFVFRHDGADWHPVADLDSPQPAASGGFGWDVAMHGEFVIASSFNAPRLAAVFER